jgi:predicted NAD/FAD-dependent oxidoreductase
MASIAIIGAGIAGLAAARHLQAKGHSCILFDKSRGLGGRMATRRVDGWQFDHGAQYFTARGDAFREQVKIWTAEKNIEPWFDDALVGAPTMTAPARALASGMMVVADCEVAQLEKSATGWRINSQTGFVDAHHNGAYDAVILAIPAPQADAILRRSGVTLPELAQVRYAPCWALMLGYQHALQGAQTHWRFPMGDIAWIARNRSKPARSGGETLVVHAGPEWSRQHLEETPDRVMQSLLPQLPALIGDRQLPIFKAAHRWRFALVEDALNQACIWKGDLRLGACGDWCLGPRVECAYDSGLAMANTVLASHV